MIILLKGICQLNATSTCYELVATWTTKGMGSWGEQFSTGDQGDTRKTFWKSGCRSCPSCHGTKVNSETHCAGCRHNGDGYGTEVYTCADCQWTTSFQYDEAGTFECWAIAVRVMLTEDNFSSICFNSTQEKATTMKQEGGTSHLQSLSLRVSLRLHWLRNTPKLER